MKLKMESYLNHQTQITEDPRWMQVVFDLSALAAYQELEKTPDKDYGFLILEGEQPVEGCLYIQTSRDLGGKTQSVEVRIEEDGGKFRHYHKDTESLEEILADFQAFYEGRKVDITGWEDWTDQF